MSIRYELIIYWSEDDQSFVVEVPELPGCMADGETYEAAVANARQVIDEWLDTARDSAREMAEVSVLVRAKLCKECSDMAVIKKDACEFCTACGGIGACG
jgi:predicted RNase H-like HicB family nuclease